MGIKAQILDEIGVERALKRISHEIVERNKGIEDVALVGIKTRGVPLAHRISKYISEFETAEIQVGELDISLYRDDLTELLEQPEINSAKIDFDVKNKTIILVDDVLYTGRTVRAAMEAIIRKGRPKSIQLAVLIDRGHRELPIRPDYVGKNLPTALSEIVYAKLLEIDGEDKVIIIEN